MKFWTWAVFLFPVLCLALKVHFIFAVNAHPHFNPDDKRSYLIAQNYLAGKGYGLEKGLVSHYRLSAYHSSANVFLYQFLITKHVSTDTIVLIFFIISTSLYLLAVWFLYRILQELGVKPILVYLATVLFALYPSVMYAIGAIYHFDNVVMPLHVIHFYYLLKWVKGKTPKPGVMIFLILSITLCCFLRSQVLPLYFLTGCYMLVLYSKHTIGFPRRHTIPVFWAALALCILMVYVPVLIKNKKMFNAWIISTQAGFEFLEGHNPFTKGNWILPAPGTPLENYVHSKYPHIDSLDEYSDSKLRTRLAWEWIRANPGQEVKYAFKKMGRYFFPENQQAEKFQPFFRYHPFTILVHGIFLLSIGWSFLRNRPLLFSKEVLLLMIPVIATLLLSVTFYFDMRLRYHAEPFLIIIGAFLLNGFLNRKQTGQENKLSSIV